MDIVSAIEFDETGEFIAVGDRGGRVVVFERSTGKERSEYKFFAEFQSHDPEFDYLKSLEIEEKINKIRWCSKSSASHGLLTTNGLRSPPFFPHQTRPDQKTTTGHKQSTSNKS